jgi:putative endonuclease
MPAMAYYVYLLASKKHGWFEIYDDITTAIAREKELKKWRRDWKIRLIEEQNPGWVDLYPGISN